jgi:hypothetical protein
VAEPFLNPTTNIGNSIFATEAPQPQRKVKMIKRSDYFSFSLWLRRICGRFKCGA